jgi:hypothetical protein
MKFLTDGDLKRKVGNAMKARDLSMFCTSWISIACMKCLMSLSGMGWDDSSL